MHVHASDSKLTEESSAKFFVKGNGDYDVASLKTLDFYEICRNQLLEDYFTEKTELEYAGNACHF